MSNSSRNRRQHPATGKRPANAGGNGHQPGKSDVVRHAAGADTDAPFTFRHEGRTYRLPSASDATDKMPAGHLIDALMSDDTELAEMRLGIATLQAADVDPEAMAALRAMTLTEFTEVVGRWLRRGGVNAPESERSST